MAYNVYTDARVIGKSGAGIVYNDLLGNPSTAKLPAVNDPAWTDITLDGFTLKALAFQTNDYYDIIYQTHHGVALNATLENHIHWTIASDDNGDEFQFQISGVVAAIGGTFDAITPLKSGDVVLNNNAGKHNYLSIGDIPAFNSTVSSLAMLRLTRIAPDDGDDTSELIYVLFNDCHAQLDTLGSLQESSKI